MSSKTTPKPAELRDKVKAQVTPEEIQRQLDEALADSFPASDPVSIVTSQTEESWSDETKPAGARSSKAEPRK